MKKYLFLLLFGLVSCQSDVKIPNRYTQQHFCGREDRKTPLYRANVPNYWKRIDPQEPIHDTTKPVVTFLIEDSNQTIQINIHTFPAFSLKQRIPPRAQIERWKRQIKDQGYLKISPYSSGGFAGFVLEGKEVLAFAMQLDREHFQMLRLLPGTNAQKAHHAQMCFDYTIKAQGAYELLREKKEEISMFANSFELIDPIMAWR